MCPLIPPHHLVVTWQDGGEEFAADFKLTGQEPEIPRFIVKTCSPPSTLIAIDISTIHCSRLSARSSKTQRTRALILDVSMLDLIIEPGISLRSRAAERIWTETTRPSVTSPLGRSMAYPRDRNKWDRKAEREAGHLRALLTPDFLSQLKARSRDGGGAALGHVGPVDHYRNLFGPAN